MRRQSARKRQEIENSREVRQEFAAEFTRCWVCGKPASDTHEIARGQHRSQAVGNRCALARLCRKDHDDMGDFAKWPLARQYALKAFRDPEHYNRVELNAIRDRAPDAIDENEVWMELQTVLTRCRVL